jgi:hypothetical protein
MPVKIKKHSESPPFPFGKEACRVMDLVISKRLAV